MASSPVLADEYIPTGLSDSDRYVTAATSKLEGGLSSGEIGLRPTNLAPARQLQESARLKVRTYGRPPNWVLATARAFDEIMALPTNWDSYSARRVDVGAAEAAFAVLGQVMTDTTPPPVVIPMASGGVQLEWHERGIDLEIAVYPDRRVEVLYEDLAKREPWEGNFREAQEVVAEALGRISAA